MLDVKDDQVVVEEKGIYSVENFLSARRLMYWQVYLHKTTVSCEKMLMQLIRRAKYLAQNKVSLYATKNFLIFLEKDIHFSDLTENEALVKAYCQLDDYDIWASIKEWSKHEDNIIASLSNMILERRLFKIKLSNTKPLQDELGQLKKEIMKVHKLNRSEINYFFVHGSMSNSAYIAKGQKINILTKSGTVVDIAIASDLPNIKAMSKIVRKYYLCWPKIVSL
jgi:HD superfamily phosphohydrolase